MAGARRTTAHRAASGSRSGTTGSAHLHEVDHPVGVDRDHLPPGPTLGGVRWWAHPDRRRRPVHRRAPGGPRRRPLRPAPDHRREGRRQRARGPVVGVRASTGGGLPAGRTLVEPAADLAAHVAYMLHRAPGDASLHQPPCSRRTATSAGGGCPRRATGSTGWSHVPGGRPTGPFDGVAVARARPAPSSSSTRSGSKVVMHASSTLASDPTVSVRGAYDGSGPRRGSRTRLTRVPGSSSTGRSHTRSTRSWSTRRPAPPCHRPRPCSLEAGHPDGEARRPRQVPPAAHAASARSPSPTPPEARPRSGWARSSWARATSIGAARRR